MALWQGPAISVELCPNGNSLWWPGTIERPWNLGQTCPAREGPSVRHHRAGRSPLLGVTTLSGGGEKTDEPFIGELTGKDNRSFVFADTDGFWNGQLDGDDALSFCYMQTHSRSTVVSCSQVKRTR
jgi:hypothetical protein